MQCWIRGLFKNFQRFELTTTSAHADVVLFLVFMVTLDLYKFTIDALMNKEKTLLNTEKPFHR
jgi:hypothetical protein